MSEQYLIVKDVKKSYKNGDQITQVLKGVSTSVNRGEICAILGSSGSGKSTLLNCIGALETMDSGSVVVDGMEIGNLNTKELTKYRRDQLGFIFQFYNLIPNLTVKENIEVCKYLTKEPLDLDDLLETLGLTDQADKFPQMLSGGQQQRCAIARALIKNPKLLLCDEPTGAVDSKTAKEILCMLEMVNKKYGTTILMVTHNLEIKKMCNRVIILKDGVIKEDYTNETIIHAADLEDL